MTTEKQTTGTRFGVTVEIGPSALWPDGHAGLEKHLATLSRYEREKVARQVIQQRLLACNVTVRACIETSGRE